MGSFLNVVASRKLRCISVVAPASHCFECGEKLKFYSLIPVLSYVFQRGSCIYCGAKIPIDVLLSEIIIPILFILGYYNLGIGFSFLTYIFIVSILYIMVLTDIKSQTIYDSHLVFLFVIAFIHIIIKFLSRKFIISVAILQIILYIIYLSLRSMEQPPMGEGDVLVYIALLCFFDFKNGVLMMFLSFWIAAIIGAALLLTGKDKKYKLAFMPFIFMAYIITVNYGENILMSLRWV